jgi:hypothetical protein
MLWPTLKGPNACQCYVIRTISVLLTVRIFMEPHSVVQTLVNCTVPMRHTQWQFNKPHAMNTHTCRGHIQAIERLLAGFIRNATPHISIFAVYSEVGWRLQWMRSFHLISMFIGALRLTIQTVYWVLNPCGLAGAYQLTAAQKTTTRILQPSKTRRHAMCV